MWMHTRTNAINAKKSGSSYSTKDAEKAGIIASYLVAI